MANQERGELGVTVGGKRYTLRPAFDAISNCEEISNKPIAQILLGVQEGRMSGVRAMAFCLLNDKHGDEIQTLKDASQWIELAGGADVVLPWFNKVLELNTEPAEAADDHSARPPSAQAGIGELSSSVLVE